MNPNIPDIDELLDAARSDRPPAGAKAKIKASIQQRIAEQAELPELLQDQITTGSSVIPKIIGIALVLGLSGLVVILAPSKKPPSEQTPLPVLVSKTNESTEKKHPKKKIFTPSKPAIKSPAVVKTEPKRPPVTKKKSTARPKANRAKAVQKADQAQDPAIPSQLKQELALINKGKSNLRSKSHDEALQALSEHETKFLSGVLADERQLLRILVYCDLKLSVPALKIARGLMKKKASASVRARIGETCARSALIQP